jgi:hypothetical protein
MILSIQVVTPLKMPIPMKETMRNIRNGFTFMACFNPSSINARTCSSGEQGGVGGFSRAKIIKIRAEKAAMLP